MGSALVTVGTSLRPIAGNGGAHQGTQRGHGVFAATTPELMADDAPENPTGNRRPRSSQGPVGGSCRGLFIDLLLPTFASRPLDLHNPHDWLHV
jgi:hypothetical protein